MTSGYKHCGNEVIYEENVNSLTLDLKVSKTNLHKCAAPWSAQRIIKFGEFTVLGISLDDLHRQYPWDKTFSQ